MADIEKALALKKHTDSRIKVPKYYYKFLIITLEEGKQPGFSPLYSICQNKLKVLYKYLKEHLLKGFISASTFSVALPVIFVKKLEGDL
ncbi:hypothetical protein K432DRAFT_410977 [Lepidopterella palustris CBS 459.81]|uniref:Uncharacterized protein n=1 Tax=Lepidopterella palustris CBS 459.81 TaxID=1314670 RepID=A0A8E2DWW6_9PEZI|nr:hypothetical protein K432DRAFT_410977 [Lepidopterella palustris CBS 459.81]